MVVAPGASELGNRPLRSLLFTPGQRERMVAKALALDVDAVILDLEDGVPPAEKDAGRQIIADALAQPRTDSRSARLVRVNAPRGDRLTGDLEAVVCAGLDAVVMPKVETPAEVTEVASILDRLEEGARLAPGAIRIVVSIESARGLAAAAAILGASPRVTATFFGAEDFALDLGLPVRRSGAGHEMLAARSALVLAAAIARVQPIDQVWLDFNDGDGLRRDAITGRELGFVGKCLIHPAQVATVNEVFSPSEEDVALARRVVSAYEEAMASGVGAVMLGGQLVELPIVERAQRTLRFAEMITSVRDT